MASRSRSELAGKVVVVTGASGGIGEAVVLGFAAAGARLVLASRKVEGVAALAEKIELQGIEAAAVASQTCKAAYVDARAAHAI